MPDTKEPAYTIPCVFTFPAITLPLILAEAVALVILRLSATTDPVAAVKWAAFAFPETLEFVALTVIVVSS